MVKKVHSGLFVTVGKQLVDVGWGGGVLGGTNQRLLLSPTSTRDAERSN